MMQGTSRLQWRCRGASPRSFRMRTFLGHAGRADLRRMGAVALRQRPPRVKRMQALHRGLERSQVPGPCCRSTWLPLAELKGKYRDAEAAPSCSSRRPARSPTNRRKWCEAEIFRLRARYSARYQDESGSNCCRRHLQSRGAQRATLWNLRSASCLAELWRDRGSIPTLRGAGSSHACSPRAQQTPFCWRRGLCWTSWCTEKHASLSGGSLGCSRRRRAIGLTALIPGGFKLPCRHLALRGGSPWRDPTLPLRHAASVAASRAPPLCPPVQMAAMEGSLFACSRSALGGIRSVRGRAFAVGDDAWGQGVSMPCPAPPETDVPARNSPPAGPASQDPDATARRG